MQTIKLITKFFFLSCIVVGILSSSVHAKETSIIIWTSSEGMGKAINEIKESFEIKYKRKVKVEILNKDLTSLFKTAALTGKGPDILLWANDVSGDLAQSGLIEPLDDLAILKDTLLPVSLQAFRYKGRLYGYPLAVESLALFYNTKIISDAPKTFEELFEWSKKNNQPKKDKYAFLFDIKTFFFSFPILNAGDGYIFKETSAGLNPQDVGINKMGFVEGLNFLQSLTKEGIVPTSTDRGVAISKFKLGQNAVTIDGPWSIKELDESKVPYKMAALPTLNGKPAKPFVGVQGFMIRRTSKQKLAAKILIEEFLLAKKSQKLFYEYDKRVPARIDALDELSIADEKLAILKLVAMNGTAMPNIPQMGSVWGAMGKALSLGLEQSMDAQKALDSVMDQIK
jgi:maltose/maltodextrin transport system substrate-binding protein